MGKIEHMNGNDGAEQNALGKSEAAFRRREELRKGGSAGPVRTDPEEVVRRLEKVAKQGSIGGISTTELQKQLAKAYLEKDLENTKKLFEEKQERVHELVELYKSKGLNLPEIIRNRIVSALELSTPSYYLEPLDKIRIDSGGFLSDTAISEAGGDLNRLSGLLNIVVLDEVARVKAKLASGARDAKLQGIFGVELVISTAQEVDMNSRLQATRVNIGVSLESPFEIVKNLPPTYKDWQDINRPNMAILTGNVELMAAVQRYYAQKEHEEKKKKDGPPSNEDVIKARSGITDNEVKILEQGRALEIKRLVERHFFNLLQIDDGVQAGVLQSPEVQRSVDFVEYTILTLKKVLAETPTDREAKRALEYVEDRKKLAAAWRIIKGFESGWLNSSVDGDGYKKEVANKIAELFGDPKNQRDRSGFRSQARLLRGIIPVMTAMEATGCTDFIVEEGVVAGSLKFKDYSRWFKYPQVLGSGDRGELSDWDVVEAGLMMEVTQRIAEKPVQKPVEGKPVLKVAGNISGLLYPATTEAVKNSSQPKVSIGVLNAGVDAGKHRRGLLGPLSMFSRLSPNVRGELGYGSELILNNLAVGTVSFKPEDMPPGGYDIRTIMANWDSYFKTVGNELDFAVDTKGDNHDPIGGLYSGLKGQRDMFFALMKVVKHEIDSKPQGEQLKPLLQEIVKNKASYLFKVNPALQYKTLADVMNMAVQVFEQRCKAKKIPFKLNSIEINALMKEVVEQHAPSGEVGNIKVALGMTGASQVGTDIAHGVGDWFRNLTRKK